MSVARDDVTPICDRPAAASIRDLRLADSYRGRCSSERGGPVAARRVGPARGSVVERRRNMRWRSIATIFRPLSFRPALRSGLRVTWPSHVLERRSVAIRTRCGQADARLRCVDLRRLLPSDSAAMCDGAATPRQSTPHEAARPGPYHVATRARPRAPRPGAAAASRARSRAAGSARCPRTAGGSSRRASASRPCTP